MNETNTEPRPSPAVAQTKQLRKDLDDVLQSLKKASSPCCAPGEFVRSSRERSIAITKIQEGVMWLGMDLKDIGETPNPYPESYNPESPIIEPTADGIKL
jgi:hypothetical protein